MNQFIKNEFQNQERITLIIDRIEGEIAVCEEELDSLEGDTDPKIRNIRISDIPFSVCEKDTLIGKYNENGRIEIVDKLYKTSKKIKIPTKFIRFT